MLCITESWLAEFGDEPVMASLTTPGYSTRSHPRTTHGGGGVVFIYRNSDISVNAFQLPSLTSFDAGAYTIKSKGLSCCIVCIYRPGYSSKNKIPISKFLDELRTLCHHLHQKHNHYIICGDLIIHLDIVEDNETKLFNLFLEEHDLRQLINVPTHVGGHILDVLIIPSKSNIMNDFNVFNKSISDHFLVV